MVSTKMNIVIGLNRRKYWVVCIALFLFLWSGSAFAQKSKVIDLANSIAKHASSATLYARQAYNATNLREWHEYARKAKLAAEDGESEAADATTLADYYGCDDAAIYLRNAESYLNDAASYARKAYNSDSFDDAQYYIRKSRIAAEDAESEVINATNECLEFKRWKRFLCFWSDSDKGNKNAMRFSNCLLLLP